MSCKVDADNALPIPEVTEDDFMNELNNCVIYVTHKEKTSELLYTKNIVDNESKSISNHEDIVEKLEDEKGKNEDLPQIRRSERIHKRKLISSKNTSAVHESSKNDSDSSDDEDNKDTIIVGEKYFKNKMLKNISKEYEKREKIESLIIERANIGERVKLYYLDGGNRKHYFAGEIDGEKFRLVVEEAVKLFKYGYDELKLIEKKKIQCVICNGVYPLYDSFIFGDYYICMNCSCTEPFTKKKCLLFVDPLAYEKQFLQYSGIFIRCRHHLGYTPISRFVSITKNNKCRFHKHCHDCRQRYKKRPHVIDVIKHPRLRTRTRIHGKVSSV